MNADAADSERWKAELLTFAQVRAELLAVVMANHPEFTLEEAERMLRGRILNRPGMAGT